MQSPVLLLIALFTFSSAHAATPVSSQTAAPSTSGGLSLGDAFKAALEKTETTRIQDSRTEQAKERVNQAKGAIYPHLYFNWTYLRQDVPDAILGTNGATGAVARTDQSNSKLTATQALFRGFREFDTVSGLNSNLDAQKLAADYARISLFANVASTYYTVLASDRDLTNINDLIKVSEDRIRELTSFTKLGRSRRSDLLVSQAQVASLKAQAVAATGVQVNAREQFAFATGLPAETRLAEPDAALIPQSLGPLDKALASVDGRPDIKAQKKLVEAAESGVKVARGNYWPTLDLTGNYYLARTGALEGGKWDAGLALVFPIFEGFTTVSAVQQAQAAVTEQRLLTEQSRRSASRDISAAYKLAATGLDQLKIIKDAQTLTERAYQEVNRDFRRGASTNLDVLQAFSALQDARRTLDKVYYQTILAIEQLNVAQGVLPGN